MIKKRIAKIGCLIFLTGLLLCQTPLMAQPGLSQLAFEPFLPSFEFSEFKPAQQFQAALPASMVKEKLPGSMLNAPVKIKQYHAHLAFFCKIEEQMAKNLPLPFKFRLGDQNYVDYLEQKGRANELNSKGSQ